MIELRPNAALEKEGKRLCKEAREIHNAKKDYSRKEIYQSSKEAAKFLVNKARGRVALTMDGFNGFTKSGRIRRTRRNAKSI